MLLVVGSFNLDLVHRCERFPSPGETVAGSFETGPGGKGANQAVAAARAGGEAAFVAAVGKDSFADRAREFLAGEKNLQVCLIEKDDAPTGTAGITVETRSGQNKIVVALGANLLLEPDDIPKTLLDRAKVVVCQFETNRHTVSELLKQCRKRGVLTILNPAPMQPQHAHVAAPHADIIVANEAEFSELVRQFHPGGYGDFTEEQIHALTDAQLHELCRATLDKQLVLTLGARGAFISTVDRYRLIKARSNLKIVDTVGAGDCFVGSLAARLSEGADLLSAAEYANAAAGLACTKVGAAAAMPFREEVEGR